MWKTTLCVISVVLCITIRGNCTSEPGTSVSVRRRDNLSAKEAVEKMKKVDLSDNNSQKKMHTRTTNIRPGGPCYEGTASGDCIPLKQCPPIRIAIQRKETRLEQVRCRIDRYSVLPYVCCPNGKAPNTSISGPNETKGGARPGSRISMQKCYEYAKAVYQTENTHALIQGTTTVDKCVKIAESLIVNGTPTRKGEFPHMALLGFGEDKENLNFPCGGSLVSERFVMTAAHCYSTIRPTYVLLGEHVKGTNTDGNDTQLIAVQEFIAHPEYKPPALYFDIALIRLSTPAKLTPLVRPACLHSDQHYKKILTATGWGQEDFLEQQGSDLLYRVDLDEVNDTYCKRAHRVNIKLPLGYLSDQLMCVGKLDGGKDTCQGDSGGPIQVPLKDPYCSHLIVGITSFGKGCGLRNTPGVYVKVSKFIKWLEDTIWGTDGNETSSTVTDGHKISSTLKYGDEPSSTLKYGNEISSTIKYGDETSSTLKNGNETSSSLKYGNETVSTIKYSNETSSTLKQQTLPPSNNTVLVNSPNTDNKASTTKQPPQP